VVISLIQIMGYGSREVATHSSPGTLPTGMEPAFKSIHHLLTRFRNFTSAACFVLLPTVFLGFGRSMPSNRRQWRRSGKNFSQTLVMMKGKRFKLKIKIYFFYIMFVKFAFSILGMSIWPIVFLNSEISIFPETLIMFVSIWESL
jgi:hypothetical protein